MRLDTFLIADHAVAAPDGKVYINGGGVTRLDAPELPFLIPTLSVVTRFAIDSEDVGDHSVLLQLETPDGQQLLPQTSGMLHVGPPEGRHPDEELFIQAVFLFGGVPITMTGSHVLSLELDHEMIRRFVLPVVRSEHPEDSAGGATQGSPGAD